MLRHASPSRAVTPNLSRSGVPWPPSQSLTLRASLDHRRILTPNPCRAVIRSPCISAAAAPGDGAVSVSVRASSGSEAGPSGGGGGAAGSADGSGKDAAGGGLDEALRKRLEALIVAHPVMLFMKGARFAVPVRDGGGEPALCLALG